MQEKMDIGTAALALAAGICERAADLLDSGWVQGTLYTYVKDGKKRTDIPEKFCVLGALSVAFEEIFGSQQRHHKNAAMELAQAVIIDEMYESRGKNLTNGSIPAFNDRKGRTQEEVVGVMERAAARLWNLSVVNEDVGYTWAPSEWAASEEGEAVGKQFLSVVLA